MPPSTATTSSSKPNCAANWPEAHKGNRPITETWLARRLAPFGIGPKLLFFSEEKEKRRGYELESFLDAFERFLKPVKEG